MLCSTRTTNEKVINSKLIKHALNITVGICPVLLNCLQQIHFSREVIQTHNCRDCTIATIVSKYSNQIFNDKDFVSKRFV